MARSPHGLRWVFLSVSLALSTLTQAPGCGFDVPSACDKDPSQCTGAGDMGGKPTRCQESQSCAEATPICDQSLRTCRACRDGENELCAQHNPETPTCYMGRCVACAPMGDESFEAAECQRRIVSRSTDTPVCDAQQLRCRACSKHKECASGVCAKDNLSDADGMPQGACVPASQVVVVNPLQCSAAGPVVCAPRQAIALLNAERRYVVIRRSAQELDFSEIEIGGLPTQGPKIHFIGPLADEGPIVGRDALVRIGAPDRRGFIINKKHHVTLEGFFIAGSAVGVQCFGDGPNTETQVRVLRSLIADNKVGLAIHDDCRLTLDQSWVGAPPKRSRFYLTPGNDLALDISRADFDIVSSVFADNGDAKRGIYGGIRITSGLGGGVFGKRASSVIHSTFYGHPAFAAVGMEKYTTLICDQAIAGRLLVMNSLLFQDPQTSAMDKYVQPTCGAMVVNVATDEQTLQGNQVVKLPRTPQEFWMSAKERDLRPLAKGSPKALEAILRGGVREIVVNGATFSAATVDMDGRPRLHSQEGVTLGAYEPAP